MDSQASTSDGKPSDGFDTQETKFGVIQKLYQIRRDADDTDIPGNDGSGMNGVSSVLTADDNPSVPFLLSSKEEERLLAQVTELAKQSDNTDVSNASSFFILACLRTRKGDPGRAIALLANYLQWRRRVGYYRHVRACADSSLSSTVLDILNSKLLTVAGNTSRDGRPVFTCRYRYLNPRKYSADDTARALGVVFEYLLRRYPTAQTHGIVVVDDAAGFSISNMDVGLLRFLARAFSKVLPIRVAAAYIVNPSWIVNIVFNIMAPFMSNKLKTRLTLCPSHDYELFAKYFEPSQTPTFLNLNGSFEWSDADQSRFVQDVIRHCADWPPASSHVDTL